MNRSLFFIRQWVLCMLLMVISLEVAAQNIELPAGWTQVFESPATDVKSQDKTGTCWSFSTTSFIESEILRTSGKILDLSEMFTVRNIYLDKAERYLRYQGKAQFSQGSLSHDVFTAYDKYGMMPETAYPGHKNGKHDHTELEVRLKKYLDSIVSSGAVNLLWQQRFEAILDHYLGPVPEHFDYEGKSFTAVSFASEVLKLSTKDYVGMTSFTHHPFDVFMVVEVPDNFSDGIYFNVPIDTLMAVMKKSLDEGYTVEWDGDVSEVGFMADEGIAIFISRTLPNKKQPLHQIPEDSTSQELRQLAFDTYSTTDDHLMHITGMAKSPQGKLFYMVKNSWGPDAGIDGYMLISEAYMKMKTVTIYVNKSVLTANIQKLLEG